MIQDGFFVLLKPTAFTSNDAIMYLRNRLSLHTDRLLKLGHLGTLDPGASGVLPIAVGSATKLFDYLRKAKKVYRAQAVLGKSTDTLDSYGNVIEEVEFDCTLEQLQNSIEENIQAIFNSFIGKQMQMPPDYSSKSVGGVRAYDLIRKGEKPNLKESEIEIFDIKLIEINGNKITFDLYCSGGTYVRSFVRDLGVKLGYPAYMSYIIRKEADGFTLNDCNTFEEILNNPDQCFITLEDFAKKLNRVDLKEFQAKKMGLYNSFSYKGEGLYAIYNKNLFFAIGYAENGVMKKICGNSECISNLESFDKLLYPQKTALCLGYFDSVHLGHQEILKKACSLNAIPTVLTFYPSLKELFGGGQDLYSFERRVGYFSKLGVNKVFYLPPTKEILNLTPDEFLKMLFDKLNISYLIVGENYTFGKNASGTVKDIERFIEDRNCKLIVIKEKRLENIPISTTAIKEYFLLGELNKAREMLGRDISLKGLVVSGRKQGREIGFPTININLNGKYLLPRSGVYSSRVRIGKRIYRGVTNIGSHPTFKDYLSNAETYILDFDADLYGKLISVTLKNYLRPIISFSSIDELKEQIAKDCEKVKNERD